MSETKIADPEPRADTAMTELDPREKLLVTLSLMLAMAVAALEQTVVSTAMPSIVSELKGVRIYPWVSSAYLLAFTISTPLYGKLADLWGRKRVLLFGLALFLLGSALSGLAWSMPVLIAMRVVQGLGFGAIMPIVLTIIGDVFTLRERARVQGWFSSVWAVSGLLGPLIGGVLTDQASWRWVFFVTLPFGLFAMGVLAFCYRERLPANRPASIDWLGAALLAAATSSLLLLLLGKSDWGWLVRGGLGCGAVGALGAFIAWEKRAREPILPLDLFQNRTLTASILGSFVIGSLLFLIEVYLPLYIQGVAGGSAIKSGVQLTPLLLSWSLSVMVAARAVLRHGFRRAALTGSLLITLGMALIAIGTIATAHTSALFFLGMLIIGLGMGPTSLSYILSVQSSVPWQRRGVATGALSYFRTMGGALVVAALGAILAARVAGQVAAQVDIAAALRPESHQLLDESQLLAVRDVLRHALRDIFLVSTAIAGLGLLCAWNLPRTATDPPSPTPEKSNQNGNSVQID